MLTKKQKARTIGAFISFLIGFIPLTIITITENDNTLNNPFFQAGVLFSIVLGILSYFFAFKLNEKQVRLDKFLKKINKSYYLDVEDSLDVEDFLNHTLSHHGLSSLLLIAALLITLIVVINK